MLAEASTKDISEAINPSNFEESKLVAKVARAELEAKTGKKVVTNQNAKKFIENKP
ncbi:hypothetical protein [Aliarcobacter cryaerophilus]|uniref:hypothetical protein n=1 Tax=Aliarcobacter cryaerophilus TaxID=28198 RepID=UPI0021B43C89|nr:hypothetical protein [Aliarcobacter cryaerophilus]MCT7507908.1 hypothetical protein [Aliarcobacter cryaerophilus]